ncbi:MAG: SusD/RagB family nutrient-binding outer membrane lipoprotein [Flavihumibacter sp.]
MKNYFIILFAALTAISGCKKFIDVNNDPNRPTNVKEALILPAVETAISHYLFAGTNAIQVQHFMQAVALNQPVPNTGTYQVINSESDGDWATVYTTTLNNLKAMIDKAGADGSHAYVGIGKILFAYTTATATDFWGDIPLTESLKGADNFTPLYDTQESVYTFIQQYLDEAIAELDMNSEKQPDSDDFFYNGDLGKWKKLAYTLKARYYMHLTKAPGHTASQQATLALAALEKGMTGSEDALRFSYPGSAGNENPWYLTFLPGSTLVLSEHLVETLKSRNDPRLPVIVAPAAATGLYTGRPIGTPSVGSLEDYSIPAALYGSANSYNYIVNYEEALFLKAEATFITSGSLAATPVYQEAVKTNFTKLGLSPASSSVLAFLADRGTLTDGNGIRLIMEEKSTANFLNLENWTDWRRTGYPAISKVPNALSDIPRRFLYPRSELISNPQPGQSARMTDRIWWDAQ